MSVLVLLEVQVKPEAIVDMKSYLAEILPETRAYDGCLGIDVYTNTEDKGNFVAVEYWDTRTHHQEYSAWRTEKGDMEKISTMTAGPPNIRFYERIDA